MVSDAFLSIPINQKCQILSFDTLVANEPYGFRRVSFYTITQKCQILSFDTLVANEPYGFRRVCVLRIPM